MDGPSAFEARSGGAPGQPGLLVCSSACGGGLGLDGLWGPFQPQPFYDSMITSTELEPVNYFGYV